MTKSKLNFEKQNQNLEDSITEYRGKLEDAQGTLNELNNDCNKNTQEIAEIALKKKTQPIPKCCVTRTP